MPGAKRADLGLFEKTVTVPYSIVFQGVSRRQGSAVEDTGSGERTLEWQIVKRADSLVLEPRR
jgi:hypothetical protein